MHFRLPQFQDLSAKLYAQPQGNFIIFSKTSQHLHLSSFHYKLMPRSLCRGRTPVAPESLLLSLHCLNKEAKSMKNGLSRSHPSKLGMLSSAFIHFCDLSSIWILGTWYHSLNYFWGVMALDICNLGW